jgi:hypothetical protein
VRFDGWFLNGSKVNIAIKNNTIVARLTLSEGESGQYALQVVRDINLNTDEVVKEVAFEYDGISASKEIAFTPMYASDESNTNGYFMRLKENDTTIWSMDNDYPPRLGMTPG